MRVHRFELSVGCPEPYSCTGDIFSDGNGPRVKMTTEKNFHCSLPVEFIAGFQHSFAQKELVSVRTRIYHNGWDTDMFRTVRSCAVNMITVADKGQSQKKSETCDLFAQKQQHEKICPHNAWYEYSSQML